MIEGPFPPTLDAALDASRVLDAMHRISSARFGATSRLVSLEAEHIQRRLIRYTAEIEVSGQKDPEQWTLIGKVYDNEAIMDFTFGVHQALCDNGFSPFGTDSIRVPEPIGCVPELRLLLMAEAPGGVLRPLIKRRVATEEHARHLARAMIKMHNSPIETGADLNVETCLAACDPSPQVMADAFPDLSDEIAGIVQRARKMPEEIKTRHHTLVHGDLHPGQIFVENGHLWLLDLDDFRNGHPAHDLAEIFGFLKRTGRKKKNEAYICSFRDAFLDEYFSAMDTEIARSIPLYEAVIGLRRACKCLRVQDEAGWEEKLRRLVRQAAVSLTSIERIPETIDLSEVVAIYERSPGSA